MKFHFIMLIGFQDLKWILNKIFSGRSKYQNSLRRDGWNLDHELEIENVYQIVVTT